ncbi:MAG: T9SS type A sorting domain-containing protein [Bacteroidetes bacterium]|nr:T9SS type A sorting domain-containing protein [Bacteroidota bacterium]MCL1968458.1 T9SS type A sorting domain-containing protein [Bacteroidota bacterium]
MTKITKQMLTIAPNPVSGIVTIFATDEIQQLDIFDITGKLVVK